MFLASYDGLYAFHYSPQTKKFDRATGWDVFSPEKEFARMGIPNDSWRYSSLNEGYKVNLPDC